MGARRSTVPSDHELAADVGRDLVARIAPRELPLFRPISEAYFADPERAERAGEAGEEMLGFGVGGAEVMLTPIVLAVVTQVIGYLGEQVTAAARAEGASLSKEWVRWCFGKAPRPPGGEASPPHLSPAELQLVHKQAVEKGLQLGLPPATAQLLSDALVGSLAAQA